MCMFIYVKCRWLGGNTDGDRVAFRFVDSLTGDIDDCSCSLECDHERNEKQDFSL